MALLALKEYQNELVDSREVEIVFLGEQGRGYFPCCCQPRQPVPLGLLTLLPWHCSEAVSVLLASCRMTLWAAWTHLHIASVSSHGGI